MIHAFQLATSGRCDAWSLHLYGSGPLKDELVRMADGGVHVHPFVQPEQLAGLYHEARAFCLPSLEEHWGVVVHEAALSGCVLLLSNSVGAAEDLLGNLNGFSFDPLNETEMVAAFRCVMTLTDSALATAYDSSLHMARTISKERFASGVWSLIN